MQQLRVQALLAPPIWPSSFRSRDTAKARQTRDASADAARGTAIQLICDVARHCQYQVYSEQDRIAIEDLRVNPVQYPLRRSCCSCSGCRRRGCHWRGCHGSSHRLLPLLCTLFCPGPALVPTGPKCIHVEVAPLVLQEKRGKTWRSCK